MSACVTYTGALALAISTGAAAQTCTPYWASATGYLGGARALAVFDDGSGPALFDASAITLPGMPEFSCGAAKWDGMRWTPIVLAGPVEFVEGQGLAVADDGAGMALHTWGLRGTLTGTQTYAGRWDGHSFAPSVPGFVVYTGLGSGVGTSLPRLMFDDGTGFAPWGVKRLSEAQKAIVRWNGAAWEVRGIYSAGADVRWLLSVDTGLGPRLYALGNFQSMSGVPTFRVARWEGDSWSAVGQFPQIGLDAATVLDGGAHQTLWIGNDEGTLAKWDGTQWTTYPNVLSAPPTSIMGVSAMGAFDDGSGRALYIAGAFTSAGGIPVRNIARFDGQNWSPVGPGVGPWIDHFAVYNGALWAGGQFGHAGGGEVPGLAQWVGCPNCYANCDNSTRSARLNVLDFMCFLNKFSAQDPYANCTVDATIDMADFICFMNKFAAGCP